MLYETAGQPAEYSDAGIAGGRNPIGNLRGTDKARANRDAIRCIPI